MMKQLGGRFAPIRKVKLLQVTVTVYLIFIVEATQVNSQGQYLPDLQHAAQQSSRTSNRHHINESSSSSSSNSNSIGGAGQHLNERAQRARSSRIMDLEHLVGPGVGALSKLEASGRAGQRQASRNLSEDRLAGVRGEPHLAQVSSGAKVVLSVISAIVFLVASATVFDFLADCAARKRTRGYDDIHSQTSDANTESMLIHETDSTIGDEGPGHHVQHAANHTRRLAKQMFVSFSFRHSYSLIFQQSNGDEASKTAAGGHHFRRTNSKPAESRPEQLSIDSLHGLRFLSMIWIIIIHTYSFAFDWSFFKSSSSENIYKTAASQLIANGVFACDSFFLIGGFLLPYLTFPAYSGGCSGGGGGGDGNGSACSRDNSNRSRNLRQSQSQSASADAAIGVAVAVAPGKQQTNKMQQQLVVVPTAAAAAAAAVNKQQVPPQFKFTFLRLLANLLHRYLRMMPLMMAIIGLSATLLRYLDEGPAWDYSTQMYDKWCRKNWWINALFLHNFLNRENMCLSHSWYAAVDLQLFLLGQVILFVLARSKWLGILMCCLLLLGGQLITALITLAYHLPALPLHASISPQSVALYYGEIYIKPYCRASPYLIGILLAYLMRTTSLGQVKLRQWQTLAGWTISIGSLLVILLSTLPAMNGQPPGELESALYNALSRPLWACATGWIVFACITKHGGIFARILSTRLFIPFSRLSYAAFLIHPIVMAISYGGRQASVPFSHYLMLCLVLGNIVITYASAFLLSALFELPLLSAERALKRSWQCRNESMELAAKI